MRRAAAIIGVALLPGLASLPVAAQQDDRSYLTALLEDNLSGAGREITITGFAGALSSKARLTTLTIADDTGVWLTLNDVVLDWSRASLLSGAVVVRTLTAGEIVLDRIPAGDSGPSAEAKPFALPELPVSVSIGEIRADRIVLGETVLGEAVVATVSASAELSGGEGSGSVVLERTDGKQARIALSGSYANASGQLVLDLSAVEAADGVAVRLLGIPGAPSAEFTVKGAGPITDFEADVSLKTDDVTRLAGAVNLTGDETGSGFTADLSGDVAPVSLPQYAEFFGPEVRLVAAGKRDTFGRMSLSQLRVTAQALDLSGQVDMAADGLPQRFNLQGRLALADGGPVLLPLTTGVETRVTSATIALSYDATTDEGWTGSADLIGLDRADFKADTLRIAGSGRISRAGETPVVGATLNFAAVGLAPADPDVAAALGSEVSGVALGYWESGTGVTRLSRLVVQGDDYDANLRGSVAGLASGFNLSGTAEVNFDELSRFSGLAGRTLGGSGSASVTGFGSPLSGQFDVDATVAGNDLVTGIAQLDGVLRGASTVTASVKRDETGTALRAFEVVARGVTAQATGRLATGANDITADLAFSDLSVLGAGYGGTLTGQARLLGDRATLDATGQGLSIGQAQADRLLAGDSVLSVAVVVGQAIEVEKFELSNPQVTASARGRLGAAQNAATATVAFADLSVLGGGYGGSLTGDVVLAGDRVTVDAVGRGLSVGQAGADRVLRGDSTVSVMLRMTDGGVVVEQAEVRNPQITATATGSVDGAVRRIALDARLGNLALLVPQFPGALTVSGTAVDDGAGYVLNLRGQGPGQIDATVRGRISGNNADLAIAGTAQAALANAFIDPRTVEGPLRFDLGLRGPLALSSLNGSVTLTGGRIVDPALNFALQNVVANVNLSGGTARIEATAGVTSGGSIALRGSVGLAAPFAGDLAVDLTQVVLRNPDLYETTMNGNATVTGPLAGGALIAGRVALTETEVRIPSTGFAGSRDLPELKHLREPADVRATRARAGLLDGRRGSGRGEGGRAFGLNLIVSAPNRVFVRGRGLDAELGGELTLTGTTANIVPFGAFNLIRGRLDILGRRLDLTEALLQMEGALLPYLTVRASTENDGYTTTVAIDGPANDPVVSFTSSPDLPEEEVLARLLFGQGLQNLSPFQAAQLAGAVASLAGRGGEGLVARLRQGIGLDNLDVQTSATGGTSVTAGKYLTENIYTEVTVGDEGTTRIDLNLDITKSITLKAGSNSEGATGVGIYLEKDY